MNPLYQKYANSLDNNPNARTALNTIIRAEGTDKYKQSPYQTGFAGTYISDMTQHPGSSLRRSFVQTNGKTNTSTAAGAYQFMPATWNPLAKKIGVTDFSQRSQDIMALALMDEAGALKPALAGDVRGFAAKANSKWMSFPGGKEPQPARSADFINKAWQQGGGVITEGRGVLPTAAANLKQGKNTQQNPTMIAAQNSQSFIAMDDLMSTPVGQVGTGSQNSTQSWLSPLGSSAQNTQNQYQISWLNPAPLPNF